MSRYYRHNPDEEIRYDWIAPAPSDRQMWRAAAEAQADAEIAWRYDLETIPLTLLQTIQQWARGLHNFEWNWNRTTVRFRPIKPGEAGYDSAPYETSIIVHRDVLRLPIP